MGNVFGSETHLDGLKFPSNIKRDFPISAAAEKVKQLLRASINSYRLSSIALPITAAYFLGASPRELTQLYEKWVLTLCEPWPEDDPVADSIGKFNLPEWYGDDRYEQRYYEYFRDCLTEAPQWDAIVTQHMDQLWTRLTRNDLRPILELAAGIEMDNGMIVSEALAMACTDPEGSLEVNESASTAIKTGDLAVIFRNLAKRALATRSLKAVTAVHGCAEVFLSANLRILSEHRELVVLDAVDRLVSQIERQPDSQLPIVEPREALDSQDHELVLFTRSRLVLKFIAT